MGKIESIYKIELKLLGTKVRSGKFSHWENSIFIEQREYKS